MRPKGITLMAVLFFWLALAGLLFPVGTAPRPLPAQVTAVAAALAAAAVAVGLWRMQRWALPALYLWGGTALVNLLSHVLLDPQARLAPLLIQLAVLALCFRPLTGYLQTTLGSNSPQPSSPEAP